MKDLRVGPPRMRSKPKAGTPGCAGGGGEWRRHRRMAGGAFLPCCRCPPCFPVSLLPLPDPSCNGDWGRRPEPNGWNPGEQTPSAHSSATLLKFVINKEAYSSQDLSGHLELQMSGRLPHGLSPFLGSPPSLRHGMASLGSTGRRAEDKGRRTEVVPLSLPAASLQVRAACFCSATNSAPGSVPTTVTTGRRAPHRQHGKQTHRW